MPLPYSLALGMRSYPPPISPTSHSTVSNYKSVKEADSLAMLASVLAPLRDAPVEAYLGLVTDGLLNHDEPESIHSAYAALHALQVWCLSLCVRELIC